MQNPTSLHHQHQPLSPAGSLALPIFYLGLFVPVFFQLVFLHSKRRRLQQEDLRRARTPTWNTFLQLCKFAKREVAQPNVLSLEQFATHLAVHIRQPKITTLITISQPFMVKT